MTTVRSPIVGQLGSSRPLLWASLLVCVLLAVIAAMRLHASELFALAKTLPDFDAFYIAGKLAGEGRASDAYHFETMLTAQREFTGTDAFMPWTYPPPFMLLMQAMAMLMPIAVAFLIFTLASFAFYVWVLRRIAGAWFPGVLIAIAPVLILNLLIGQNGFLIGGLMGAFLLRLRDNHPKAGLPLGMIMIKPHLAIAVGLLAIIQRRWSILMVAAGVVSILTIAATLWYGPAIWLDFRVAVKEASGFLAEGLYPLFRMNSVYAAAYSWGASASAAMACQVVSALVALTILGRACLNNISPNRLAALACAASVCISPYGYDYDLTILGVGLAFIVPDILARASGAQCAMLMALMWIVSGYGIVASIWARAATSIVTSTEKSSSTVSIIAPVMLLLFFLIYRTLARESADQPE